MTSLTERKAYGLTGQPLGIITMTTLTIHDVTATTISQQAHVAFTCQTLTIETADGQTIALKLFRSEPQVDGVKDVLQDAQDVLEARQAEEVEKDLLLMSVRGTLEDWGYSDYPHYNALVHELFLEAQRPGNDVNLNAPSLMSCLTWGTSSAGSSFYSKAYTWLQNNY